MISKHGKIHTPSKHVAMVTLKCSSSPQIRFTKQQQGQKVEAAATVGWLCFTGLSAEQLLKARKEHAAFFEEAGRVPKFKAHYDLHDKQHIDYVRTLTAKNVW